MYIETDFHYATLANFRCTKIKINQVHENDGEFCNNTRTKSLTLYNSKNTCFPEKTCSESK